MDMITLLTLDPATPIWVGMPTYAYVFHAACLREHANVKGLVANARTFELDDVVTDRNKACWGCGRPLPWTR